mgnify:CR=1 FL=1
MGGLTLGQANQIYAKWKRILFSPENSNEIYLILEKDNPMTLETAKALDERYKDKDVILTITLLIRNKVKKHGKRV